MAKLVLSWISMATAIAVASSTSVDETYRDPCSHCARGPPGIAGLPGRDGRDGRDYTCGAQQPTDSPAPDDQTNSGGSHHGGSGSSGSSGNSGNTGPSGNTGTDNSSGAVYIRWGRDVCTEGSQLVYAGTAAGALYTQAGSGSNYLCMPHDPIYDEHQTRGTRGRLYSSEYETSTAVTRLRPLQDNTPKCAVCRAPSGRSTKLMVPGRNICPSDEWRLEYGGYIMSASSSHKRTEFVCFDREMEAEPGTEGNQNGALFYMVTVACLVGGGLPCGPYVEAQELTCAVCTI